jgi:hypothetical protein
VQTDVNPPILAIADQLSPLIRETLGEIMLLTYIAADFGHSTPDRHIDENTPAVRKRVWLELLCCCYIRMTRSFFGHNKMADVLTGSHWLCLETSWSGSMSIVVILHEI